MRGSLPLIVALSAYLSVVAGLPQLGLLPRASAAEEKPKYSVVPLEPGDDQPGSGGNGSGHKTGDVTVVLTVVKTQDPATQTIIKTADPKTVTRSVPTTISVIDISGDATTTVTVTHIEAPATTVTVQQSSHVTTSSPTPSSSSASGAVTTNTTTTNTIPSTESYPSGNSTYQTISSTKTSTLSTSGTVLMTPTIRSAITALPTTFKTITSSPQSSSSSRTYDNGQWHTTYPPWNGTLAYRFKRS